MFFLGKNDNKNAVLINPNVALIIKHHVFTINSSHVWVTYSLQTANIYTWN